MAAIPPPKVTAPVVNCRSTVVAPVALVTVVPPESTSVKVSTPVIESIVTTPPVPPSTVRLNPPAFTALMFNVSPALFVENQGQWADESVRFMHQGDGVNVAMTDTGPVFQLFRSEPVDNVDAGDDVLAQ